MVAVHRRLFVFFLLFAVLAVGIASGAPASAGRPSNTGPPLTDFDNQMIQKLRDEQENLLRTAGHAYQVRDVPYHHIPDLYAKMTQTAERNGVRYVGESGGIKYIMTAASPEDPLGREMGLRRSGASHDLASIIWKIDPRGWRIINIDTIRNPGLNWRAELRPFQSIFRPA